MRVVRVTAAGAESDGTSVQTTSFALDSMESISVVNNEVASCVLAEWDINAEPAALEYEHDG
jgi:hypothetical protein